MLFLVPAPTNCPQPTKKFTVESTGQHVYIDIENLGTTELTPEEAEQMMHEIRQALEDLRDFQARRDAQVQ